MKKRSVLIALLQSVLIMTFSTKTANQSSHPVLSPEDNLYNHSESAVPSDLLPVQTAEVNSKKGAIENYYSNLSKNSLTNNLGICGYVSVGMLLSYYDTYYSDSFIPESMESEVAETTSTIFNSGIGYQSPGIFDTMSESPTISELENEVVKELGLTPKEDISNYRKLESFQTELDKKLGRIIVKEIDSYSFIGKLFSIAIEKNDILLHYPLDAYRSDKYESNNSGSYLSNISVSYQRMCNLLTGYIEKSNKLSPYCQLKTSRISSGNGTSFENEQTRIKKEIIALIKEGKPVIVGGNHFTDTNGDGKYQNSEPYYGHVCIAYSYDEKTNTIYGNRGWGDGYTQYSLNNYFNKQFSDYYALDISKNFAKSHTRHYYFTDIKRYYSPYRDALITSALQPSDYGFDDAYPTDEITSEQFKEIEFPNGTKLSTRRYRTGYIHNEYIVMSCIRPQISSAFIEYQFDYPVYGVVVNLSFWRDVAYDLLDKNTGKAFFSIFGHQDLTNPYDSGGWMRTVDLLSDETNLSRNRNRPTNLTIEFNQPIKKMKFECSSSVTTTENKNFGRICIGNLQLITKETI